MLEPKEITLTTQAGEERTYVITKFPALAGREIVAKYPVANIPKLGDYKASEEAMLRLMAFVGVPRDGQPPLLFVTRALIESHVPDWETLAKLEMEALGYNCSFFGAGKSFAFSEVLKAKLPALISLISTAFSEQSSQAAEQPSTS